MNIITIVDLLGSTLEDYYFLVYVLIYFLSAIGFALLFKKAKEAIWKAFIPLYNSFCGFKISWNAKAFAAYIIFGLMLVALDWYFIYSDFYNGFFFLDDIQNIALPYILCSAVEVVFMAIFAISNYYLAKAFNKGIVYAVLLTLLFPVMILVLGCSKTKYVGNTSIKPKK